MAEYYSLEEAAAKLGLPLDDVREMAKNPREIRSFKDGASWKFRKQDIDEMSRRRTMVSDPDVGSGDSIHGDADIFSDEMPVVLDEGALSGIGLGSGKGQKPTTPRPTAGSDVKLAFGGDDVFGVDVGGKKGPSDSDVKLTFEDSGIGDLLSRTPKPGAGKDLGSTAPFEIGGPGKHSDLAATTAMPTPGGPATPRPGGGKNLDATAPINVGGSDDLDFSFDDSGANLKLESKDDSSDFDLAALDSSEVGKKPAEKKPAAAMDKTLDFETIDLGDDIRLADDGPTSGPSSGINLKKADDSGISLEDSDGSSSSEFELSVDSTDSLPSFKDDEDEIPLQAMSAKAGGKPAAAHKEDDLSSDFELALDEDESAVEAESGSEVVALDDSEEEEYDEAESDYDGYDDEPVAAAGASAAGAGAGAMYAAEPAPWSSLLLIALIPTTLALCAGGIVVLETMRQAFYYQENMKITGPVAELGEKIGVAKLAFGAN